MNNNRKYSWTVLLLLIIAISISCKKSENKPEVRAAFSYKADTVSFLTVKFFNESENAISLSWDFGDSSAISTETNPVHTYAMPGSYTVILTAAGSDGTSRTCQKQITLADPNILLTNLAGTGTKTWKLIRTTGSGRYPLEYGPADHSAIWWAMGYNNDEIANRPCMLNDEWTFGRDNSLVIDLKGDNWREDGYYQAPDNTCGNTTDPQLGPDGENLAAWAGGSFTFVLTPGAEPTLKAVGKGAYIGHIRLGNGSETTVPLDYVTYRIEKLYDAQYGCDTLILEGLVNNGTACWRYVLVHYDDPSAEPPVPGKKPVPNFFFTVNGLTVNFFNTTTGGETWHWDFGDLTTSDEENPSHTFSANGPYHVTLTASNANGSVSVTSMVFLSIDLATLTDAMIRGGAWKVRADDRTIFLGMGMGSDNLWFVPKEYFTGGGTGGDDWSCMPDDEFTFLPGGGFTYQTNGSARNDGYFGTPNGCWSDSQIAGSGNGAAFGSCTTHSYVFIPAIGTLHPGILLTNGAGHAAFLGFYKGYYGGVNTGNAQPPNGGNSTNLYQVMGYANTGSKEYLFVSVDVSPAHDGSMSWSAILER